MNTATQNLEHDHVFILKLTDVMLAMVEQEIKNSDDFDLVVSLIRKFADGVHHAKEEDLLFPLMGKKGFSAEQGPVAVMLHEHVQGRNFVKGMIEGITAYRSGNDEALQSIYENMAGYANLLQNHISKENNILFRMADQAFNDGEQQYLLSQFAQVEANADSEFDSANSIQKINNLAAKYL